jgi:DNA-binding protein Fis
MWELIARAPCCSSRLTLTKAHDNNARAAMVLGVSRRALQRMAKQHGLPLDHGHE